jgi:hypothetical protein
MDLASDAATPLAHASDTSQNGQIGSYSNHLCKIAIANILPIIYHARSNSANNKLCASYEGLDLSLLEYKIDRRTVQRFLINGRELNWC